LRSWIFNRVLDRHIDAGNWRAICEAEVPWSGPMWGRGRNKPTANEDQVESEIVSQTQELCNYLEHSGLNQDRRILLAQPTKFIVLEHDANSLKIEFELGKGQFATELLTEIGVEESM